MRSAELGAKDPESVRSEESSTIAVSGGELFSSSSVASSQSS